MTTVRFINRREFVELTGAAAAGLLLACRVGRSEVARAAGDLDAWIHVGTDNWVTLTISESEMGQGVLTSLSQILADELDADWSTVRAVAAPADRAKYGQQSTGGSTSVRLDYDTLRKAGAGARQMLIGAAAAMWSVPAGECRTEPGVVLHDGSGRRATYGELADQASARPIPRDPPLKDPKDFRLIGKPVKRLDTHAKVTGTAVFGIDVRQPDMLIAVIAHPPVFGGAVQQFDATRAKQVPGVRDVVEVPTGVAVVADNLWAARNGRAALDVQWDDKGWGTLSSAKIREMLVELCPKGAVARNEGDATAAFAGAAKQVTAVYETPYLAHATMEPMTCVAHVGPDGCDIRVGTQAPTSTQDDAARITGLKAEQVSVQVEYLGGGFGRRSHTDFVMDAVYIAKAVGQPVKLIWMREDDMRAGRYRPVTYNELSAGLDADGWPVAWIHRIAGASIMAQFGPLKDGVDDSSVEGAANLPYRVQNLHVTYAKPDLPITTWWWRSVGSSQNAYVTECFLDEVARAAGKDPLEFRRHLLDGQPRLLRVLDTAAQHAGWGRPLPAGHAMGIAVHACFGSFVAQAAEVSLRSDRAPRVHRVVCAVDCGSVVNPDTIAAQMESGIIFGLSAALYGEITIENGGAVQSNFNNYPIVRMGEAPAIETHIVTSDDPLGGIGEPGTPPIAPAVCNAILALTGKPVRRLPIGTV
jgi:isoquinoline 1-oxidoreductase beta subunit